ncbi:uncharacterized protein si:ch211-198p11.6 [Neolamprologus brichardi]|uniref:uncharacterized protein si:ch211-198p11.6 n=1 Tax=Neolamprologus brichardi TaxID=32507 RepID=UPI001643F1E6|nr:uncharacterized protein si:ch211-198p11.6 [Neolamprologus brichardi]
MPVLPVWRLAIPLPAVLIITVSLYMIVLGIGLWIRYCLKDYCSLGCSECCAGLSVCEQCIRLGEMCDCRLPAVGPFLAESCSPASVSKPAALAVHQLTYTSVLVGFCGFFRTQQCSRWDCACTCQVPDCDSCNCLCFEIRMK